MTLPLHGFVAHPLPRRQLTGSCHIDMVSHMKTTINIADRLLEKAKRRARQENKTLREIVEEALRRQLSREEPIRPFRLKRHTFKGKGLQPGTTEGDWEKVRDLIYRLG